MPSNEIDIYTLMNMPFYTEFCNIMYIAGDEKIPEDESVVLVMDETRRRMKLLIDRLLTLIEEMHDRKVEIRHVVFVLRKDVNLITRMNKFIQNAADPHIFARCFGNEEDLIEGEEKKTQQQQQSIVDWTQCHKLMAQAMQIVDPFDEFGEFDDAPNRQRQAKCYARFRTAPPSEYFDFTEAKKQATFLKKDITGRSSRQIFWAFMKDTEKAKHFEENVFFLLTYVMKEYVTRLTENAATMQKMAETQRKESPRKRLHSKYYEAVIKRDNRWKKPSNEQKG